MGAQRWKDGWMEGRMCEWNDRWVDGGIDGWMGRWKDEWVEERKDGWREGERGEKKE